MILLALALAAAPAHADTLEIEGIVKRMGITPASETRKAQQEADDRNRFAVLEQCFEKLFPNVAQEGIDHDRGSGKGEQIYAADTRLGDDPGAMVFSPAGATFYAYSGLSDYLRGRSPGGTSTVLIRYTRAPLGGASTLHLDTIAWKPNDPPPPKNGQTLLPAVAAQLLQNKLLDLIPTASDYMTSAAGPTPTDVLLAYQSCHQAGVAAIDQRFREVFARIGIQLGDPRVRVSGGILKIDGVPAGTASLVSPPAGQGEAQGAH